MSDRSFSDFFNLSLPIVPNALLDQLKHCIHTLLYAAQTENLILDDNPNAAFLCFLLEKILQYGLKASSNAHRPGSMIGEGKSDAIVRFFDISGNAYSSGGGCFWPYVENLNDCLPGTKKLLNSVRDVSKSQIAKGRIFIRASLNESGLKDHLSALFWNRKLTSNFYHPKSIALSEDHLSILLLLLEMLEPVKFSLFYKDKDFEKANYWLNFKDPFVDLFTSERKPFTALNLNVKMVETTPVDVANLNVGMEQNLKKSESFSPSSGDSKIIIEDERKIHDESKRFHEETRRLKESAEKSSKKKVKSTRKSRVKSTVVDIIDDDEEREHDSIDNENVNEKKLDDNSKLEREENERKERERKELEEKQRLEREEQEKIEREERAKKELEEKIIREEQERIEREEREKLEEEERLRKEREDKEREEREERERIEREEKERMKREKEEKERQEAEDIERKQREERERIAREKREREDKERKELEEKLLKEAEEKLRRKREAKEKKEREEREKKEEEERERIEAEEREKREIEERERKMKEEKERIEREAIESIEREEREKREKEEREIREAQEKIRREQEEKERAESEEREKIEKIKREKEEKEKAEREEMERIEREKIEKEERERREIEEKEEKEKKGIEEEEKKKLLQNSLFSRDSQGSRRSVIEGEEQEEEEFESPKNNVEKKEESTQIQTDLETQRMEKLRKMYDRLKKEEDPSWIAPPSPETSKLSGEISELDSIVSKLVEREEKFEENSEKIEEKSENPQIEAEIEEKEEGIKEEIEEVDFLEGLEDELNEIGAALDQSQEISSEEFTENLHDSEGMEGSALQGSSVLSLESSIDVPSEELKEEPKEESKEEIEETSEEKRRESIIQKLENYKENRPVIVPLESSSDEESLSEREDSLTETSFKEIKADSFSPSTPISEPISPLIVSNSVPNEASQWEIESVEASTEAKENENKLQNPLGGFASTSQQALFPPKTVDDLIASSNAKVIVAEERHENNSRFTNPVAMLFSGLTGFLSKPVDLTDIEGDQEVRPPNGSPREYINDFRVVDDYVRDVEPQGKPELKLNTLGGFLPTLFQKLPLAKRSTCGSCGEELSTGLLWNQARFCFYTGQYFCLNCHVDDRHVIPARFLKQYDRKEWPVCKEAKTFLVENDNEPIVIPDAAFFEGDPVYANIQKLREQLVATSEFVGTCKSSSQLADPFRKGTKQYILDNPNLHTLQDLLDPKNYAHFLSTNLQFISTHITTFCETCKGKGHICMKCYKNEPLFPFQTNRYQCPECKALFHNECVQNVEKFDCPKCHHLMRKTQRRASSVLQ